MATGVLRVEGNQIVDTQGKTVVLRGAGLGGWLNMENFITGYPGHEAQHREAMLEVLGQEKYDFFFDKWLEYFFTAADAKYFSSLGLNCIRIPFNYRHFEDDMNPRVLKESGFKHLDRVIELCAKEGIYTILDMHTTPGCQNQAWHSDNPSTYAAFWDHKDFQDRTVWLWEQLATRYKGNAWVAGYNPLNEPADPKHFRLPEFYKRLEKAVHAIDPGHILWLDGNSYAQEWKFFNEVLPNSVYSIHDYSTMGFPTGVPYTGSDEQKQILMNQYERKTDFHRKFNAAIWNGEFGPVYANPRYEPDAESINQQRYNLLGEQLKIYDKAKIPWTIWLYKDIGLQGMVHTSPNSPWNQLIQPFLEKKKALQLDWWGCYPSAEPEALFNPLITWLNKVSPTLSTSYPKHWKTERHVRCAIQNNLLADSLQAEFAGLFRDKSIEELDELAKSFHFDQCVQEEILLHIMALPTVLLLLSLPVLAGAITKRWSKYDHV